MGGIWAWCVGLPWIDIMLWAAALGIGAIAATVIETGRGVPATLLAAASAYLASLAAGIDLVSWVANHPLQSAAAGAGYLVAGTVWGGWVKWRWFLRATKRRVRAAADEFLIGRGMEAGGDIPDSMHHDWSSRLRSEGLPAKWPLRVADHRGRIVAWMAFWPLSLLWTLLDDPVRRAFNAIYNGIAESLQNMSNRAFADMGGLLPKAER